MWVNSALCLDCTWLGFDALFCVGCFFFRCLYKNVCVHPEAIDVKDAICNSPDNNFPVVLYSTTFHLAAELLILVPNDSMSFQDQVRVLELPNGEPCFPYVEIATVKYTSLVGLEEHQRQGPVVLSLDFQGFEFAVRPCYFNLLQALHQEHERLSGLIFKTKYHLPPVLYCQLMAFWIPAMDYHWGDFGCGWAASTKNGPTPRAVVIVAHQQVNKYSVWERSRK